MRWQARSIALHGVQDDAEEELTLGRTSGKQAMVGDGEAVGVASQIVEHMFGTAVGRLGIEDSPFSKATIVNHCFFCRALCCWYFCSAASISAACNWRVCRLGSTSLPSGAHLVQGADACCNSALLNRYCSP